LLKTWDGLPWNMLLSSCMLILFGRFFRGWVVLWFCINHHYLEEYVLPGVGFYF